MESSIVFNEFADNEVIQKIEFNNDRVDINEDEKTIVKISENFEYENDDDLIRFDLKVGTECIPIGIIGTNEKIGPIEGMNVWRLKREKESDFKVVGDNKIQHGTRDFFTRDEFRKSLELEKKIVD